MPALLQNSNTARLIDNAAHIGDVVWQSIDNLLTSAVARMPYLIAGILVLVLFWVIGRMGRSIFLAASRRTNLDRRLRILFSRLLVVFIYVIGLFTAFTVIVPSFSFGDVIAGLGFTSFVIGFATKDILNNLLSGILILWQRPFSIGDYLFVGTNQGKVEYIGVRATSLRKDDGELVLVPNGDMYSSALTIRGAASKRRMNLKVAIDFDVDIASAKEAILAVLPSSPGVVAEPRPKVVVTDLNAEGVNLAIYFWIDMNESKPLEVFDAAAAAVKESLEARKIEIFPRAAVPPEAPAPETKRPSSLS